MFGAGAFEVPAPELWPCCVQAVECFVSLGTQWRIGPSGQPYGLDNTAVEATLRMLGVPRRQWRELLADLRVMEQAAVAEMRE